MSFWKRLGIARRALVGALWHYRYTLIVLPIVGWLVIGKLEPLEMFVLGALGGYFQAFVERCTKNYAELLGSAEEHRPAAPASATRMSRTAIAPTVADAQRSPAGIDWSRIGVSVLKGVAWAALIVLLMLAVWNLYLYHYRQ